MNSNEWNSITVGKDEQPQVNMEDLRELAADLDPDDFDEPVQEFLDELMKAENTDDLKKAATLLMPLGRESRSQKESISGTAPKIR